MQIPISNFNGFDPLLFPKTVESKEFFELWFPLTDFGKLTDSYSKNGSAPIKKYTVTNGEGYTKVISRALAANQSDEGVVDTDVRRGFEDSILADAMEVNLQRKAFQVKYEYRTLMQLGTPVELINQASNQLALKVAKEWSRRHFDAMTTDMYSATVNGSMPADSRVVAGTGTYNYAAGATLTTQLLAAMPNATANDHKMSVKHIRALNRACLQGSPKGVDLEAAIAPAMLRTSNGWTDQEYYLLVSPEAGEALIQDADFEKFYLTRGISLSEQQASPIRNSIYLGKVFGVHVIQCPELSRYTLTVGTGKAAWSIMLGSSAMVSCMFEYPSVKMIPDVQEDSVVFQSNVTRAIKTARWRPIYTNPNTAYRPVEGGLMHSFTRIS